MKLELYVLYAVNAAINTTIAIITKEWGWINVATQLWLVTLLLYINREKLR